MFNCSVALLLGAAHNCQKGRYPSYCCLGRAVMPWQQSAGDHKSHTIRKQEQPTDDEHLGPMHCNAARRRALQNEAAM